MVLLLFATLYICSIRHQESGGIHSVLSDTQPRKKERKIVKYWRRSDGGFYDIIGGDDVTMMMIRFDEGSSEHRKYGNNNSR